MEKVLVRMGDIMQEIINEIKEGGVQLIDHTTSLLCVIATNVQGICLSKAIEVGIPSWYLITSMMDLVIQCID